MKCMAATTLAFALTLGFAQSDPASWSDQQKEEFLLKAEIVSQERIPTGITRPKRATLRLGEIEHDAHIQTVDEFKHQHDGSRGTELNFRDSYRFNIAAYRVDRLVNLGYVPVSVERRVGRERAAVTWWIDDILMMDVDRYTSKQKPPDPEAWNDQMYNVRVFNELVFNTDINLTNVMILKEWSIRLIDFSRAFRTHRNLRDWKNIEPHIDQRVYEGLKALTPELAERRLSDILTKGEIRGLMARRDRLVEYFDKATEEHGREAVICSKPGH